MEEMGDLCRVLVGKPGEQKPHGRRRFKWEDNIKTELQDMFLGMDWDDLAKFRERWRILMRRINNLQFPLNAENSLNSLGSFSF